MPGPAQPALRQGDVIGKKYEVEAALGAGPCGETYACRVVGSGKKVAVKLLAGPAVDAQHAMAAIAKIKEAQGENLVAILDQGEQGNRRFVVSEHADGDSLRRLMDEFAGQRKSFTLQEAGQLVKGILEAADAAHQAGLVHRHIKPTQVVVHSRMVGPGKAVRTAKLTGLGFSALLDPATLAEAFGAQSENRYAAPELNAPHTGGSPQSDVYSAGVIFYELLCGQTPMGTYLSPSQIRDDLPKHVDDIVDIAMAANAEDRYPTARDMINDIQRTFTDDDGPKQGMTTKQIGTVVAGALGLVALVGGYLLVSDPEAEARRADAELRAHVVKENPTDPAAIQAKLSGHPNMAYVPAGTFIRGRMRAESPNVALATEPLAAKATLGAYYIDVFEYENAKDGHPVVGASWEAAGAACKALNKRLCTGLEWERACKGPENTIYAYGDTFDPEACGPDVTTDSDRDGFNDWTSGAKPGCKSGWGVYDLGGGPAEWTADAGKNKKFKVIKGGKPGSAPMGSRCSWGIDQSPTYTTRALSFRCCMDDDGSLPIDPTAPPAGTPEAAGASAPADGSAPPAP